MMTKHADELAAGDVVVDAKGRTLMTVRVVKQAVEIGYSVVWFFGPKGGKQRKGFANNQEWAVRS